LQKALSAVLAPVGIFMGYMAKPEEFPEGLQTGRIRGIWKEGLLPIQWQKVQVSLQDAYQITRIYRKLARRKGSGSLRRITVFVR
jgi:hypothetical protein